MASVTETVKTRDAEYGGFENMADIGQKLKDVARASPSWSKMNAVHREALDMILHKIGRLCSGNPNNRDGWHDIQGYGKLVEDRLPKSNEEIARSVIKIMDDAFKLRPGSIVTLYSGETHYVVLAVWADRVWLRSLGDGSNQAPHTRNATDVKIVQRPPVPAVMAAETTMRHLVNQ